MIVNLCRIIVAVTFIFSGFVKAIDPIGTQYKLQDYLGAIGMAGILPNWTLLAVAVFLAAIEFCIGIFLLFAIQRRLISKLTVAFMAFMTMVTVWIVVADPVKDCGCFGDALHLTNTETLIKNIVLLVCSLAIMYRPLAMFRFVSKSNQWIVTNYTIVFILVSSGLSLYYLPIFDFRPYHIGVNIPRGMEIPKGAKLPQFKTTFIMEKNGQRKEFTLDNYPDASWKFIDSKTVQTSEGYIPPIHDFSITDNKTGLDLTNSVLSHKGYTFLLIAPHLETADDSNFGDIDRLYEYAQSYDIPFYCLTASTTKAIKRWIDLTGAEYPFCITDEAVLKTIIRSNPGLLLLKDGTIINKWSHNNLPNEAKLSRPISQSSLGKMPKDSVPAKILEIVLWFILPLTLLTLADRLWAWSKWVRLKEQKDKQKLYHLFNKKKSKMRKKIVAGNWKMNLNLQEGVALAKEINEAMTAEKPNCDVVICTPFIHLASVAKELNASLVGLGAENCADKEKGAYTGEVSAEMVKSTGAQYVILGHSERRQYYGETAEILKEKVLLALKNGLKVIFCCGETLEERESNRQNAVVKAELEGSVFNLSAEEWKNIILAYEPIWAIGTGKTATSDQAEEMLCYIRSIVAEKYGKEVAEETSILYGGSCKASNAPELFSKPNIDGGLIGGASLKAADFKGIIDAWKK
ncbi:BT_3928 family protein [Segatella salivae]|uniref:Triosephosphate isomerase n=1 Tax=Segatella salivae TaxID=228604 RepID=A0AAW4NRQ2_9BACT|nr:BT_3928 family protein [Segatella salivae]MBW4865411.1 triose-phosphate isomerase [Segatella salivae]MBW4906629.1 triose-phosphate isomerase [Segatella salivae]MBW4909564.1 triose-phosphate isomerase [Segatella salivae]